MRPIGELLKRERNIILKGADAATRGGFTQVPNFLLKSKTLRPHEIARYSINETHLMRPI